MSSRKICKNDDEYYRKRIEPKLKPYSAPYGDIKDQWEPCTFGRNYTRFFILDRDLDKQERLDVYNNKILQFVQEYYNKIDEAVPSRCICGAHIHETHPINNKYTKAACWVGCCCINTFNGMKLNKQYVQNISSHKRLISNELNNLQFTRCVNDNIITNNITFEEAIKQAKLDNKHFKFDDSDDKDDEQNDISDEYHSDDSEKVNIDEYFKILKLPYIKHLTSEFIPSEIKIFFAHIKDKYVAPYRKFKTHIKVNINDIQELKQLVSYKQDLLKDKYTNLNIDDLDIHNIVLHSNNDILKNSYMRSNDNLTIPAHYDIDDTKYSRNIIYGIPNTALPNDDTYYYVFQYNTLTWKKIGVKSICTNCKNIYIDDIHKQYALCNKCYLDCNKPNDSDVYLYERNVSKRKWDKKGLYLTCTICNHRETFEIHTTYTKKYICCSCSFNIIEPTIKYNRNKQTISFVPHMSTFINKKDKSYYTFQKINVCFDCIDCYDRVERSVDYNWNIKLFSRCLDCYKNDDRMNICYKNSKHNKKEDPKDISSYVNKWKDIKRNNAVFTWNQNDFFVNIYIKESIYNIVQLSQNIDIHDLGDILQFYQSSFNTQSDKQNEYVKYLKAFVDTL